MSLKETIAADLATAVKEQREPDRTVLRSLLSALKNEEIAAGGELSDDAVLAVVSKQVKQREESAAAYASRPELAEREEAEKTVLAKYLPEQLSDDEIEQLIGEAISQTGASGMADMGKVMGALKPKLAGRADSGKVAGLVKARLG